jgi:hypothetical protein
MACMDYDSRDFFYHQIVALGPEHGAAPAGQVITYASSHTPQGYVPADGRALKIAEYPELYAAIGDVYTPRTIPAVTPVKSRLARFLRWSGWLGSANIVTVMMVRNPAMRDDEFLIPDMRSNRP